MNSPTTNSVPNRPCLARFTLSDNSIDSKTLLHQIVATGVPRPHVRCIQRFRLGQVDVTFSWSDLRDFVLSKASIMICQRPAYPWPAWQLGTFPTVRDAPWELPHDLIVQRLGEHCFNFNQSGHTVHFCEEHIKCSLCKAEDHLAIDCPGNWGRRTLARRTPERTEEPAHESTPLDLDQTEGDLESFESSAVTDDLADDDPGTEHAESLSPDEHSEDAVHEEDSVSESIEEFTSSEENADPLLSQRKPGETLWYM